MDQLIKQAFRGRSGGPKAPSSKEENKRPQNWFRRQILGQMSQDYGSDGIDQATAVAAAAYAIVSLEESEQNKIRNTFEPSLTQTKSKKEKKATVSRPELVGESIKNQEITGSVEEKAPVKEVGPASSMMKILTFSDNKPASPTDKIRTSAQKQPSRKGDIQPESLKQKSNIQTTKPEMEIPKPDWRSLSRKPSWPSSTSKPASSGAQPDRQASTKPATGGTEADAWERAELDKIKKKYDELEARILSWERKKAEKSRNRLDKLESELGRKRLKGLEEFHGEMEDINQIAEGARSKAKKERLKEELKAKEKANKFRRTGKAPSTTCLCF